MARKNTAASESGAAFIVTHTLISDGAKEWNEGQFVTEEEFGDLDLQRLQDIGAIREANSDDRKKLELTAAKEAQAKATAEETGRTPAETQADIDAQSTTGNPTTG